MFVYQEASENSNQIDLYVIYNYTEDLGQLEPGVYVVKLTVENGVPSFKKIVKQ